MAGKASRPRQSAVRIAILALAALLSCACSKPAPEQALRDTIAGMVVAAEAHDNDALFDPIAEDFAGSEGMDRQAFRRYVTFMGVREKHLGVQLGPLDVKLFGDRASAAFTVAVSGGPGWLPDRAQVYDVDTGWRLEDGDWMLISAKWKPRL